MKMTSQTARPLPAVGLNETDLQSQFVVSATVLFDGMQVVVDPEVKYLEGTQSSDTHVGQFIFDTRWHFWEIMAGNQPIALKVTECERQHSLSDAVHFLFEC